MHLIASILYPIIYHLVRYRRKVTRTNLAHAFPQKDEAERLRIEKAYYHHLCDIFVEAVHNLFCRPKSILRRYQVVNRELVNHYYEQGRSVILLSSHYNNWEYMITSLNFQLFHLGIGVGKPLNNHLTAKFITRRRSRFGTEIVDQTNVRQTFDYYQRHHVPVAYMMLADQAPSNTRKSYWTTFMHQETPFLYGPEYFARKYDLPVIYYEVDKVSRGHYQVRFSLLCDAPLQLPQYAIVGRYAQLLSTTISRAPQYWLWSHKRWKRTRPQDVPLYPAYPDDTHWQEHTQTSHQQKQ